jgi:hypothetical protein
MKKANAADAGHLVFAEGVLPGRYWIARNNQIRKGGR